MRRLGLTLLLCLLALAGCGGGEETSSPGDGASTEERASAEAKSHNSEAQHSPASEEKGSGEAEPESTSAARPDVPLGEPQPGSKAPAPGVPTVKGGDNSIQSFGTEGEEGPREQALANLFAYLDARLAGEFEKACSLASEEFRQQLERLIENAKGKDKPKGCAETLALFTPEKAKAALREKNQVGEVLSFRIEGPYAYLIFKGAEGKAMFIAMADDGGQWRVNVLEAEAFMPGADAAR